MTAERSFPQHANTNPNPPHNAPNHNRSDHTRSESYNGKQEHSGRHELSDSEAALRGASLAFKGQLGKPPLKPKPKNNTYSGTNGALAAATKVSPSRTPSVTREHTGGEGRERDGYMQTLNYQRTGGSNFSSTSPYTPGEERRLGYGFERGTGGHGLLHPDQSKSLSPSFIAAAIAASRSVTPQHTGQQQLQMQGSVGNRGRGGSIRSVSSRSSLGDVVETSSVLPTERLIGLFEQNAAGMRLGVKRERPMSVANESVRDLPARENLAIARTPSPRPTKPKRSVPDRTRSPSLRIEKLPKKAPDRARTPSPRIMKPQRAHPNIVRTPSPKPAKGPKPEIKSPKPTLPATFSTPIVAQISTPRKPPTSTSKPDPPKQLQAVRKTSTPPTRPIPIPSTSRPPPEENHDDASSDDSFVSANEYEYRPSFRAELQNRRRQPSHTTQSPSTAIDSLANAIVASSLASSRAASPSKASLAPPPPPARRAHLFHNAKDISRTPSPAKPSTLRTTMRKPKEESEDEREKKRSKKSLMKKHPNKHHEGDRKRWRDEITERERKRYEAVWASNRGLFLPPNQENEVCSLVVKDIWSRSRLHADVLEEVYALVDRKGEGALGKEEFVVGLWLVDQRLKGRKLPIRVSESVWRSVGMVSGIKVRRAKK